MVLSLPNYLREHFLTDWVQNLDHEIMQSRVGFQKVGVYREMAQYSGGRTMGQSGMSPWGGMSGLIQGHLRTTWFLPRYRGRSMPDPRSP